MSRGLCGAARAVVAQQLLLVCCAWLAVAGQTNSNETSLGVLRVNGAAYRRRLQELHYYNGMPANFTCARADTGPASLAAVQIYYYSKESNAVTTAFQLKDSVYMYFKLRAANNDTILTCTVKDDSKNDSNIIQMRLLLRNVLYKEGFEVNGQFLAQRNPGKTGVHRFEYHYMWEEHMTVRLVKGGEYTSVRCSVSGRNYPEFWLHHISAYEIISPLVGVQLQDTSLLAEQSGTKIACHLRRTADYSENDVLLEVTFIYYDLVPFIGGLSMSNVTLLYKDDNSTHVSYVGNSTRYYLTCNPDGPATTSMWIFYPPEVTYSDATYPNSFIMKEGVQSTLIKCLRKSDNTSIPERLVQLWVRRQEAPLALAELLVHNKGVQWVPPIAAVAVLLILILLAVAARFAWRHWCPATSSLGPHRTEPRAASCSSCLSEEHHYEVITELSTSGVPPNIVQRPQQPLPTVLEERGGGGGERYRHYDTPYEWRIFRFGLRRCACGRCATPG